MSPKLRRYWTPLLTAALAFQFCCDLVNQPQFGLPALLLRKEHRFLFSPVMSRDGNRVYYLEDSTPPFKQDPTAVLQGDLRVYELDSQTDRLLRAGDWYALARSRDGHTLALPPAKDRWFVDTAVAVVLDTGAGEVYRVCVPVPHGEAWWISDIALTSGGDHVVFNVIPGTPNRVTRFIFVTLPGGCVDRADIRCRRHALVSTFSRTTPCTGIPSITISRV